MKSKKGLRKEKKMRMNNNNVSAENNTAYQKSKKMSFEILKFCQTVMTGNQDYTILAPLCNQIVRSSTSVCSNISEGSVAYISRKDRINKFLIALKELNETFYWLDTLLAIEIVNEEDYNRWYAEYSEIEKILTKSISTIRQKLNPPEGC